MDRIDLLVSVAGWEQRFELGVCQDVDRWPIDAIMLFVFDEYREETKSARETVAAKARERDLRYAEISVSREPRLLWQSIRDALGEHIVGKSVLVNISTMPREAIWWTFLRLETLGCRVQYVYYRPREYTRAWLTRDTGQPRLLYQLSGISALGKSSCLLLLTGFDADRAAHMIEYFEPAKVILGIQDGSQFENNIRNLEQSRALRGRAHGVETFSLDAAASDHGLSAIEAAIGPILSQFDIVAASLGPKISAVALYQLQRRHEEIALAYAPSKRFNPSYSIGIGSFLHGELSAT